MNPKFERLGRFLDGFSKPAIALSGGLDSSTLLAVCAEKFGSGGCAAFIAETPYSMRGEIDDARDLCAALGVELVEVKMDSIPREIEYNPPERCYLCKRSIFSQLKRLAFSKGFDAVFDGTNADDLSDYRPGMKALRELGIISPFLECAVGKNDIRAAAAERGLKVAKKPAYACLLTRLEHGAKIDVPLLGKIDEFESFLRAEFAENVRARVESGNVRIECSPSDFGKIAAGAARISDVAKKLGFKRCTLDLGGYKMGSMNVVK